MSDPGVLGETAAGAADALQAGYFRGMLVAERATLVNTLSESRAHGGRSTKHQLDYLDSLIAALDERFASQWPHD